MSLNIDAPPIDLVREHAPEVLEALVAAHDAVRAAADARRKLLATLDTPPWRGVSSKECGSEVRAAIARDVAAVKGGREPHALAEIIMSRPFLESEYRACAGYAEELVTDWNRGGHLCVSKKSRVQLVEFRDAAALACLDAAAEAVEIADRERNEHDKPRVAWRQLATMHEAAEEWRLYSALVEWTADVSVTALQRRWDPGAFATVWPSFTDTAEERWSSPITRARALTENALRLGLKLHDESQRFPALRPDPKVKVHQVGTGILGRIFG